MKSIVLIVSLMISSVVLANTNSFVIKLDEFVLAESQTALTDTIEMTRKAWITSDSVHLSAYICGGNLLDQASTFTARSSKELVMKRNYINKRREYSFSFATSSINPFKIRLLAMTIGADKKLQKMGWVYRMGIIKFIS